MSNLEPTRTVPEEISHNLLAAVRELRGWLVGPPAPDAEVQSWPICTPEGEFAGGVWCADEDCPLQAENSEIGDFRERTFTLADLHEAIGQHIAARRERESEEW